METPANFIPLGGLGDTFEFDQPMKKRDAGYRNKSLSSGKPKVIGATKEERSRIAREVRLAAKKEKKKAKSDAKKARKLNGIMTRRATRNPEKYNKNKERNRLHAIDVERYKIRLNAVNQAQKLAAIHDPSGVSFNVGEVVTLEDGTVKSKKSLERKHELAEEKKPVGNKDDSVLEGVNPERLKLLEGEKKSHISKTALKKKKMYEPKPVPPRPIIPEGISLPEGEENWLALWDISDGQIEQRLAMAKRDAGNAKRDLRRKQREEARFRRLMKAKRRNAQKMGILFDPVQAKNEILGDDDEDDEEASDSEADSNSDSDSDSNSDSDNGNKDESDESKAKKAEEKKQKPKFNLDESQINAIVKKELQRVKKDTRKQEKAMGVYDKEPKVMTEEERAALKEARIIRKAEKKAEKKAKREEEAKLGITNLKGKQNRKARKELRKAEKAAKEAGENEVTPVIEKVKEDDEGTIDLLGSLEMALDQPEKTKEEKKSRKEKKKADKAARETIIEEISEPAEETKEQKKARKKAAKAAKATVVEEPTPVISEPVPETKEEKKARKKAEKAAKYISVKEDTTEPEPEPQVEESKKRKRSKEDKGSSGQKKSKASSKKPEAELAAQWNADALDGDAERKSKFLRLLGAGKGGAASGKGAEAKGKKDIEKVQSELERQYDYGMRMKHDGGAKRRGLGA